ncbi:MAG: ABC-2 transporter permease [Clostridiales bacterium]|nr:ABC-2 transporter permease [Clostridiales bacterium]
MKKLLYKEFKLCMHPLVFFFSLSALMFLIPSYVYLVACFFTGNAIFNSMQISNSNSDVLFTALLPISKREAVKSKYLFVAVIQLAMMLVFTAMIFVHHALLTDANKAGLDACPALLGGCFLVYSVFNATFLPFFYKNGYKAERAFLISTIAVFLFIFVFEGFFIAAGAAAGSVPFFAWIENNIDCWPGSSSSLLYQLLFIGAGLLIYFFITLLSYRRSCKLFDEVDI